MGNILKIALAFLVGILLTVGAMTRFHHHATNNAICFCADGTVDLICEHHHTCCSDIDNTRNDNCCHEHSDNHEDESSCPLRIDDFNRTDTHQDLPVPSIQSFDLFVLAFAIYDFSEEYTSRHKHYARDIVTGDAPVLETIVLRGPPAV